MTDRNVCSPKAANPSMGNDSGKQHPYNSVLSADSSTKEFISLRIVHCLWNLREGLVNLKPS